jgi:hypothetical protein
MNSPEPIEKVILPLASVFVGWLLAQVTGSVREHFRERKIRKCLVEELKDLLRELQRTKMSYSRTLQAFALKGILNEIPSKLNNHVFRNYYKDAVLGLNADQRGSFQMIHALVEGINNGIEEVRRLALEPCTKSTLANSGGLTNGHGEMWGGKIRAEYTNVASLEWHVRFHLGNQRSPDLSPYTKHHAEYVQHLAVIAREIEELVSKAASSLRREDFERSGGFSSRVDKNTP